MKKYPIIGTNYKHYKGGTYKVLSLATHTENDEVLVKISGTGICGSDLHFFRNGALGSMPPQFPLSLGHETAGVIVDKNKSKFKKMSTNY